MARATAIPVWREIGSTPVPGQDQGAPARVTVTIVGGGPTGLALALDLGRRGHRVIVLNKLDFIPAGSRSICVSKRSLDIFDRLGVGQQMVDKGVVWNVGKVLWGDRADPIYEFDMLPVKDQRRPGFVNLQQYYVEEMLVDALVLLPNVEIRWGHEVVAIAREDEAVSLDIVCGSQAYSLQSDWVIACDGARSTIRAGLGLDFEGQAFEEAFLIVDVTMSQQRPAERWFWFNPACNRDRSVLLHKQPDNVWRIDFQLGPDAQSLSDLPGLAYSLVRDFLGDDVLFSIVWSSLYTFQCRRLARFVEARIIFAGDSAHVVSPFGARGGNGGLADIDNLGWKLDLILKGEAPASFLDSYELEAGIAADENMRRSTQSTSFLAASDRVSRRFRDAVLELAQDHPFARPLVNSGRLSTAISWPCSPLNTPDVDPWEEGVPPGSPALDAPLGEGWLLERLGGRFVLLADGWKQGSLAEVEVIDISEESKGPFLKRRYGLTPGAACLIRPDQYVAARWRSPSREAAAAAVRRAKGNEI